MADYYILLQLPFLVNEKANYLLSIQSPFQERIFKAPDQQIFLKSRMQPNGRGILLQALLISDTYVLITKHGTPSVSRRPARRCVLELSIY